MDFCTQLTVGEFDEHFFVSFSICLYEYITSFELVKGKDPKLLLKRVLFLRNIVMN